MIYQLVNKRVEILPLAATHIGHYRNQFNRVFALLISMPRLKVLSFIKIGQNLLFLQNKIVNF